MSFGFREWIAAQNCIFWGKDCLKQFKENFLKGCRGSGDEETRKKGSMIVVQIQSFKKRSNDLGNYCEETLQLLRGDQGDDEGYGLGQEG